jgi:DNA-binding FadR family transcriptional regulator
MENQQITVQDLDALRSIIDLACTRGAFRAEEMADVGILYNKLSQFLQAVVAQAGQTESGNPDDLKGEVNE